MADLSAARDWLEDRGIIMADDTDRVQPLEHWMPTLDLRFERRFRPINPETTPVAPVLQQRWNDIYSDRWEWRDVPTVEAT